MYVYIISTQLKKLSVFICNSVETDGTKISSEKRVAAAAPVRH